MYTVKELAELAGVSARTLRHYDAIGLLHPACTSAAGYRLYGQKEVDLLQQILFYRERGVELKRIREILYSENFDIENALEEHLRELEAQMEQTKALIALVKRSLSAMKGESAMTDAEKFETFKEQFIHSQEEQFGAEARAKYGNAEVEFSQNKLRHMTKEDYENFQKLDAEICARLKAAAANGLRPDSEEALQIVLLHKNWLQMTWKHYTKEAHLAMADLYDSDQRFQRYYDREADGCAAFLVQAIRCHLK